MPKGSGHALLVLLYKEISVARIRLLSQGQNSQYIPRIVENTQVTAINDRRACPGHPSNSNSSHVQSEIADTFL